MVIGVVGPDIGLTVISHLLTVLPANAKYVPFSAGVSVRTVFALLPACPLPIVLCMRGKEYQTELLGAFGTPILL